MKTKHGIILIVTTICLTWFCVWYFSNDPDLTRQNKELIKERDVLKEENKQLSYKIDSLDKVEVKVITRYIKINEQIKEKDYETINSVDAVDGYSEQSVDARIRTHKHSFGNQGRSR